MVPTVNDVSSERGLGVVNQVDHDLKVLLGQRVRGLVLNDVEAPDH